MSFLVKQRRVDTCGSRSSTHRDAELVVGDEVADCHEIVAMWTWAARAQPSAPGVAVVAALGAEVPGLALRAFVDGVDLDGLGGSGCCPAAPGGLAAGVGAPSAASYGGETGPALPAHCRLGIVTHADHGLVLSGGGPQAATGTRCCQAVSSSYLVPVLRQLCRMPTSRFASCRSAA